MQGISGIILILSLHVCCRMFYPLLQKAKGGFQAKDNQNPREFWRNDRSSMARANAVQQNSFESLPYLLQF